MILCKKASFISQGTRKGKKQAKLVWGFLL
jgi:hypothetical protein